MLAGEGEIRGRLGQILDAIRFRGSGVSVDVVTTSQEPQRRSRTRNRNKSAESGNFDASFLFASSKRSILLLEMHHSARSWRFGVVWNADPNRTSLLDVLLLLLKVIDVAHASITAI
ncbi:hypothetical protein PMIN02_013154 [Paraphaeosphaeria minitans]